jgi:hypothetical protein
MPFDYPILERWGVVDAEKPPTPSPTVNFISLSVTARAEGISLPQYKFQMRNLHGTWSTLQDYSPRAACSLPDNLVPGSYTVVVTVRGDGREISKLTYVNFATIIN